MNTTILVATPSAELYGSDLQLLQSVSAMRARDWDVVVITPTDGPLVPRLRELGAGVTRSRTPVLRRSAAHLGGMFRLLAATPKAVLRIRRLIATYRPAIVYVNTLTLPWWLLAARTAGIPTVCHVHEAEQADPRYVRRALAMPLRLASLCIANSRATLQELTVVQPRLADRIRLVYNGVPGPDNAVSVRPRGRRTRLLVVGRLTARKAPHVAVEALAILRGAGYDVTLDLCGTPVDYHDPYHARLRERIARPDVAAHVRMRGHITPIWPALDRADILVAPSLGESLGNAVIEAQLADRPVVATAVQGHLESVHDDDTGLLVPLADPVATADAIARLIDEPELGGRLAESARAHARERFSTSEYERAITSVVESVGASHHKHALDAKAR